MNLSVNFDGDVDVSRYPEFFQLCISAGDRLNGIINDVSLTVSSFSQAESSFTSRDYVLIEFAWRRTPFAQAYFPKGELRGTVSPLVAREEPEKLVIKYRTGESAFCSPPKEDSYSRAYELFCVLRKACTLIGPTLQQEIADVLGKVNPA